METTIFDILISILIGVLVGAVIVSFIGMLLITAYYIVMLLKNLMIKKKNNMERKLGTSFKYKGTNLKVVRKIIGCNDCFFQYKSGEDDCRRDDVRKKLGHCADYFREDCDVIFKQVE